MYDILLRFRLGTIAVTADIKQAFLQILVDKKHQNFLRFLWYDDVFDKDPNIIVYRFTRVIFGLISSPFLLNLTLKLHFTNLLFKELYEGFIIEKLLHDLYVDDLVSSFNDENLVYKFYESASNILIQGGFQLRKWISNSTSLQKHISKNSNEIISESHIQKVLGVEWDVNKDEFIFTFSDIIEITESLPVTKRNILKVSAMFFDPLGLICPLILQVKLLFKEACILNVKWDDFLPTEFIVAMHPYKHTPQLFMYDPQRMITLLQIH